MNLFDLPVWPAADHWPMFESEDLKRLADSISERGQRVPIVVYTDTAGTDWLLDGRNRLAACELAGIEPEWERYDGDDPDEFVLDFNDERRHATVSQRAVARALTVNATVGNWSNSALVQNSVTAEDAANAAGVSVRSIASALYVIRNAPDLVPGIKAGTLTVKASAAEARRRIQVAEVEERRVRSATLDHPDLWEEYQAERITLAEIRKEIDDRQQGQIGNAGADVNAAHINAKWALESLDKAVDNMRETIDKVGGTKRELLGSPEEWETSVTNKLEAIRTAINHITKELE